MRKNVIAFIFFLQNYSQTGFLHYYNSRRSMAPKFYPVKKVTEDKNRRSKSLSWFSHQSMVVQDATSKQLERDLKVMLESRTIPRKLVLFFSSMVWVLYGFLSTDSFSRDLKMTLKVLVSFSTSLLAKHQFSILFNSWPNTSASLQYIFVLSA